MNTEEIKETILKLDQAVAKEGAVVALRQYGGGPDESQIVANEIGYLRLGIELMKAAFSEKNAKIDEGNSISVDLDYLISPTSDISFDWFERTENVTAPKTQNEPWNSQLIGFFIMAVLFGIIALALYGAVLLFR